jgi:hypothetical protein
MTPAERKKLGAIGVLNQNKKNLIVVDVDSNVLDKQYAKYFLQSQENKIKSITGGTAQKIINVNDLDRMYGKSFGFRSAKKDEDLKGKLVMNRIGKFGVDIE